MAYFVIRDAKKNGKAIDLIGDLIVRADITLDPDGSSSGGGSGGGGGGGSFPKPRIPKIPDLKYILPPKNSPAYGWVKAGAEAAGYETVEHDDFSYPERPI